MYQFDFRVFFTFKVLLMFLGCTISCNNRSIYFNDNVLQPLNIATIQQSLMPYQAYQSFSILNLRPITYLLQSPTNNQNYNIRTICILRFKPHWAFINNGKTMPCLS